ncbi:uncharacterized protein VTP21DRAFT_6570 [Calcarisporiella thermophila]|uniref:uncharacterized protein n=1 Tax=Calcarisporiella thermophila TaxID=911321 RepID=UPI003743EDB7
MSHRFLTFICTRRSNVDPNLSLRSASQLIRVNHHSSRLAPPSSYPCIRPRFHSRWPNQEFELGSSRSYVTKLSRFRRPSKPLPITTPHAKPLPVFRSRRLLNALYGAVGLTTAAHIVMLLWNPDYREKNSRVWVGALRTGVTFLVGGLCIADYKLLHWRYVGSGYNTDEYKAARRVVHARSAERLLSLCKLNGGIFTKAGQHIASLTFIVPPEYTQTLSILQDRAPYRSMEEVVEVFKREFNASPFELFEEFDETPLAAASLAQVHRAKTRDGRVCAVKVQYPDVRELFHTDIWTFQTITKVIEWMFPEFQLGWIVKDFREQLEAEFDFTKEAHNSEGTQQRFSHRQDVLKIPCIYWDLTTEQILTMEFVDGVKVNDVESLRKMGVDPKWVASRLLEIFAEMIFVHGVLHADPHAGNAMVTLDPKSKKPLLVLLDHGFYKSLSKDFRLSYCQLWRALLFNDQEGLKEAATRLGVSQYAEVFPLIMTNRLPPVVATTPLGEEMSTEEKKQVRSSFKHLAISDVFVFLESLPRDMLLVFRSNSIVRGIHKELGGWVGERFSINAKYATKGLWYSRAEDERDVGIWIRLVRRLGYIGDRVMTETRIWAAEFLIRMSRWWSGWSRGLVAAAEGVAI